MTERRMGIRGARVHNLRDVDLDVPLGCLVGIAGVSGSGKSSLALGVMYAGGGGGGGGGLSTYTRRRISQASEAAVDEMTDVPAAVALRQRPAVPGVRSTFGTMSELLNSLRLMFSRLGSYRCPNGHRVPPTIDVAADRPIACPECGERFMGMSAEDLAFNSGGACPECSGTGVVRLVDESKLVQDDSLTLREGAVVAWNQMGIQWMYRVAGELGVRIDVPYRDLTPEEKGIVMDGPAVQRKVMIPSSNGKLFELNCTYRNARRAVEESLSKAVTEKAVERVDRFLTLRPCSSCGGTRLSAQARSVLLRGRSLPEVCAMPLSDLSAWVSEVPGSLPEGLRPMAEALTGEFRRTSRRLLQLGLGYLSLDRAGSTLSTGERQRVQLARSVRGRLTGALYVLDEPSIGLHPSNVEGLLGVVSDLVDGGSTVVMVDHDVRALRACDHIIEMGPGAGSQGGTVLSQGTVAEVSADPSSIIGPYLSGSRRVACRDPPDPDAVFSHGGIRMSTGPIHTVSAMEVCIPRNRLTAVTGVSGSGKTTMVLEGLVPAINGEGPSHLVSLDAPGIRSAKLIDATPIGSNVRSTVATYCGVLDDLRRMFASTEGAKAAGLRMSDFSYNTGSLRCPGCDGTGSVTLDVQFLPDVDMECPECRGGRYRREAGDIRWHSRSGRDYAITDLMAMTIDEARSALEGTKAGSRLDTLSGLGLGYLTLGEATPALSGGEAQRLKLASEMGRSQEDAVFVFDEPTIGLHPLDVERLVSVFDGLLSSGATIVVIEHDLDLISNADYVIDMGPGGGADGGRIVSVGTPPQVAADPASVTGRYLAELYSGVPHEEMDDNRNGRCASMTRRSIQQSRIVVTGRAGKDVSFKVLTPFTRPMRCTYCGKEIPPLYPFSMCPTCGQPIDAASSAGNGA